jgi:signal transduction histidine kinase
MNSIFSAYYTAGELFVLLVLVVAIAAVAYWAVWRRWRRRLMGLEQALADARAKYDREYFRVLHDHLQRAVAHEVVKGLDYIANRSEETLGGLGEEQNNLRDKQYRITAKANEMAQHAVNITHLFAPEQATSPRELLSLRRFLESVLLELYPYAQSRGVTLRPDLDDLEPIALNRDSVLLSLRNVIHNAIRYSYQGGVVEILLFLQNPEEEAKRRICIDVKDTGIGIREQDRDRIFELSKRGDGLIEPGSGLGLYLARETARRQGGDLLLVSSNLNQGSVFRILFPYNAAGFRE